MALEKTSEQTLNCEVVVCLCGVAVGLSTLGCMPIVRESPFSYVFLGRAVCNLFVLAPQSLRPRRRNGYVAVCRYESLWFLGLFVHLCLPFGLVLDGMTTQKHSSVKWAVKEFHLLTKVAGAFHDRGYIQRVVSDERGGIFKVNCMTETGEEANFSLDLKNLSRKVR